MTQTSDTRAAGPREEDSEGCSPETVWGLLIGERMSQGLLVKELAARLNVVPAAVSKLENGPVPMLGTMRRYANALGFDITIGLRRLPSSPYQN